MLLSSIEKLLSVPSVSPPHTLLSSLCKRARLYTLIGILLFATRVANASSRSILRRSADR